MKEYIQINVGSLSLAANHNITQNVKVCDEAQKQHELVSLLKSITLDATNKSIIFVETKKKVEDILKIIQNAGHQANSIHGDKSQNERDYVLESFRTGRNTILVATDVAARGLDVEDVKHVINYDYPNSSEDYIHRIGRTGRCEQAGTAYTFFTPSNARQARELISVLQEAGQVAPNELLELAKSIPGGKGRARFSRPGEAMKPMMMMNKLIPGMKNLGNNWNMNKPQYTQYNNGGGMGGGNADYFKNNYQRPPFNKYEDKKPDGFKKFDYPNKYGQPQQQQPMPYMNNGQAGGYNNGYPQKPFVPNQDGGYKPRSTFMKPDFNGNPRPPFAGDKPPYQKTGYLGNKPRQQFGGPNRFEYAGSAGGQQMNSQMPRKVYENYKGGYAQSGEENNEEFANNSYAGGNMRPYNNRFVEHQNGANGEQAAGNSHQPQHGQQAAQYQGQQDGSLDANNGQYADSMVSYRMIPKLYDANSPQIHIPAAYGN